MTVKEFLSHIPNDELTIRLKLIDQSIKELHQNGFFAVCNLNEIEVINNEITLSSFKNKIDRLDSGYNEHGDKQDILELCAIGLCAYNHFDTFCTNKEFIKYVIDNLEKFFEHGSIPRIMQEYYIEVFARGNVIYLNDYLLKNSYKEEGQGRNNGMVKTKSTAIGRAFSDKEAAYANVLVIPAIITLVYLLIVVLYFVFIR